MNFCSCGHPLTEARFHDLCTEDGMKPVYGPATHELWTCGACRSTNRVDRGALDNVHEKQARKRKRDKLRTAVANAFSAMTPEERARWCKLAGIDGASDKTWAEFVDDLKPREPEAYPQMRQSVRSMLAAGAGGTR